MPALARPDPDHRHDDEGHGRDHDHDHGHAHGHGHDHAPASFGRAFLVGIVLNTAFVVGEAAYGLRANSVALLADAGHNLSDVLGLFLAWGATAFAAVRPSRRYTYGLRSTTILAALANALLLMVVTGGIAWEAIGRLRHPEPAQGGVVVAVAAVGVAINLATALMFMSGRKSDLNVRAAFAHMAADAAISLGVVVAGLVILRTGWLWLDPAASIVISVLVIFGTWGVLRDSLGLALHGVPDGIDVEAVRRYLAACPGVSEVHDLHVWGLSTTHAALTAHLVMPGGHPGDAQRHEIIAGLRQRFGIDHVTLQTELGDAGHPCELAPDEVI